MSFLSIFLGVLTLVLVSRNAKPPAAKGRRAVWRAFLARAGSFYYSEPGWIGYWTTVPDGEIINEMTPIV